MLQVIKYVGVMLMGLMIAACSSVPVADPYEKHEEEMASGVQSNAVRNDQVGVSGSEQISNTVYFAFDSFVVDAQFFPMIEKHARYLQADSKRRAVISGHADERGSREYNLALGQKRANAILRRLRLLGVPDTQLEAISFGEEMPQAKGHNETAWAQNRRADIEYRK